MILQNIKRKYIKRSSWPGVRVPGHDTKHSIHKKLITWTSSKLEYYRSLVFYLRHWKKSTLSRGKRQGDLRDGEKIRDISFGDEKGWHGNSYYIRKIAQ